MSKRLNNLSGKDWLKYSFSIWKDIEKTNGERQLKHPAMFPSQLTSRLIKIYSKDWGEIILDPFMGSGSTLLSAFDLGKKGIGFDISREYAQLTKERFKNIQLQIGQVKDKLIEPDIYNKSIFDVPKILSENSVDLVITSPPYWNILTERRSADRKEIRKYSDSKEDLGNIEDYQEFLTKLKEAFIGVHKVLKNEKYCIIIVMDIRKKDKLYPFHIDVIKLMEGIGFKFDDLVIWDRQKEYNNMRPLGYPWVFRVNKIHEYVLIFKK